MFETLKALIKNTKPEIILSIQDDWLDTAGGETPARFVDITWQWHDDKGNWASLEVLGAIDDAPDGNFDIETLDYSFVDTNPRCSDDTLSVVGALMRRMQSKYGTLDNDIETFENPCLLVQTLAIELCDDLVWRLFENQMDTTGTIPPEAWEYLQTTFDRAVEETNLFESLWSNL